jgi:tRNA(His) 5'-end guanylyltransferase
MVQACAQWKKTALDRLTESITILGHINNMYNTCFWSLVGSGMGEKEAMESLKVRTKGFVSPLARTFCVS